MFCQRPLMLVEAEIGAAQIHIGSGKGVLVAQLRRTVEGNPKVLQRPTRFVQDPVGRAQVGVDVGEVGQQVALVEDRPGAVEPLMASCSRPRKNIWRPMFMRHQA